MTDSQSTVCQFAPEDVISACDSNGKKVAIRTDYTLVADEEASLSEAAERIAKYVVGFSLTNGGLELAVNSHPLLLQVHGQSLWIKYTGAVEADSVWSQEVVEFAKLIGHHVAGLFDVAAENARLRERIAELESKARASGVVNE